jgi:hypothetical protein
MKLNINAEVTTLQGKQIMNEENGKPVTLGWVAVQCLMMPKESQALKSDEKVKLFTIASKIDSGIIEFSVEEIALIKKHIGDHPSVLIVGKCFEIIEKGVE